MTYHFTHILYIKYQLLHCSLQYARTGTWLTFNLVLNWKIFFFEEKNRVNQIYSWSPGFIFRHKFMIKYKASMFLFRDICIYFRKKTWGNMRGWFYLYKEFIRHLNVECFESAVPAIFPSYAPTFFQTYINITTGKGIIIFWSSLLSWLEFSSFVLWHSLLNFKKIIIHKNECTANMKTRQ